MAVIDRSFRQKSFVSKDVIMSPSAQQLLHFLVTLRIYFLVKTIEIVLVSLNNMISLIEVKIGVITRICRLLGRLQILSFWIRQSKRSSLTQIRLNNFSFQDQKLSDLN